MSALAPTPADRLTDARGRPYFLVDEDLTLDAFRQRLKDPDPEVSAYFLGKLMRQAKPDDVFSFATLREVEGRVDEVFPYLAESRPFWIWLISYWKASPLAEPRRHATAGGVGVLIDTPHQNLVNKLCALLARAEPGDLEGVNALLKSGGDLARALADCAKHDGGFSPLTLAWTVQSLSLARLASTLGWTHDRVERVSKFQLRLVKELLSQSRPEA